MERLLFAERAEERKLLRGAEDLRLGAKLLRGAEDLRLGVKLLRGAEDLRLGVNLLICGVRLRGTSVLLRVLCGMRRFLVGTFTGFFKRGYLGLRGFRGFGFLIMMSFPLGLAP